MKSWSKLTHLHNCLQDSSPTFELQAEKRKKEKKTPQTHIHGSSSVSVSVPPSLPPSLAAKELLPRKRRSRIQTCQDLELELCKSPSLAPSPSSEAHATVATSIFRSWYGRWKMCDEARPAAGLHPLTAHLLP